jgi:UDP-N-acetylmuramoyl-tripeptide--D-alanyl-D-alanine ligase
VPLSLLRFTGEEWVGVIEMGANHCGEIGVLSKIAQPDIGVITNIGYAHVGLFGSLSKTAEAKFEIIDGLNRRSGFMLLNGDDARLVAMARRTGIRAEYFGYASRCAVKPENVRIDPKNGVAFTVDGFEYRLAMPGRHFIYSALPAIFIGKRCGLDEERIAAALAALQPSDMRGTLTRKHGVDFIVDCYNANPSSMKSALVYLNDMAAGRRKVAVVGDMLELGRYTARLHTDLGTAIAQAGIDRLVAVGPNAALVLDGALKAGMSPRAMEKCDDAEAAVPVVSKTANPGDVLLLKGSRGMHLETVFEKFRAKDGRNG